MLAIVIGELLSRQVLSRHVAPTTSFKAIGLTAPVSWDPPVNARRLPAGFPPLGDAQVFGRSALTIENGTEQDALVKVLMVIDGKPSMVRNFYVPMQSNWTEQKMPQGTFILRVAQGLDFDGGARRFVYRSSFSESVPFQLSEREWTEQIDGRTYRKSSATHYRITLHKVPRGNFNTAPIDETRFAQ